MAKKLRRSRYALIELKNEGYALSLGNVAELIDKPEYEPWKGEGGMVGFIKYGNKRLPVYELSSFVGLNAESKFLIIIKDRDPLLGLLVPKRPPIVSLTKDDILPLPDLLPEKGKKVLSGAIIVNQRLYGLLDPRGIAE
ncbi:MAG TPA: chemotaxis protein CheW [bacterium (Candidatus Stahlbacteria)]|nr:chemotaxis protein CheW [Candidatus Stahlbacteria bacterium]